MWTIKITTQKKYISRQYLFLSPTRTDETCYEKMERRKKRLEVVISAEKLSIEETENSLENV